MKNDTNGHISKDGMTDRFQRRTYSSQAEDIHIFFLVSKILKVIKDNMFISVK